VSVGAESVVVEAIVVSMLMQTAESVVVEIVMVSVCLSMQIAEWLR